MACCDEKYPFPENWGRGFLVCRHGTPTKSPCALQGLLITINHKFAYLYRKDAITSLTHSFHGQNVLSAGRPVVISFSAVQEIALSK